MQRMHETRLPKLFLNAKAKGSRRRGISRGRFSDLVNCDLIHTNSNLNEKEFEQINETQDC